jgi:small-conductance mechanosensitive channel
MRKDIYHNSFFDTDRNRIMFFAWSHLVGWMLANIQTIWLAYLEKKHCVIIRKSTRKYALIGYFASIVQTGIIITLIVKNKQKK